MTVSVYKACGKELASLSVLVIWVSWCTCVPDAPLKKWVVIARLATTIAEMRAITRTLRWVGRSTLDIEWFIGGYRLECFDPL